MTAALPFPTTPKGVIAKKVALARRMRVEDAFRAIASNCIVQVQDNEIGVAQFHDGECLHQMRVGLRRLRSALGVFDDLLSLPEPLQADLDWLVAQLGPARDWDVLAQSTLAQVEDAMATDAVGGGAVAALREAALLKSRALHQSAAAAVGSLRYARFMLALQNWVANQGWRLAMVPGDKKALKTRIAAFARAVLDKDHRRLLKRGRKLPGAGDTARHWVRIAAKKTRYAAEFFGALYPKRKVKPYVKALSRLQDTLGLMNDLAVAERLLAELIVHDAALADGAAFVRGYVAGRTRRGGAALQRDWKRFTASPPP